MKRPQILLTISRAAQQQTGQFLKKMVPGLVMWGLRFIGALDPQPIANDNLIEPVRANDDLTETVRANDDLTETVRANDNLTETV